MFVIWGLTIIFSSRGLKRKLNEEKEAQHGDTDRQDCIQPLVIRKTHRSTCSEAERKPAPWWTRHGGPWAPRWAWAASPRLSGSCGCTKATGFRGSWVRPALCQDLLSRWCQRHGGLPFRCAVPPIPRSWLQPSRGSSGACTGHQLRRQWLSLQEQENWHHVCFSGSALPLPA